MKKFFSFFLITLLLVGMVVPSAAALEAPSLGPKEVYLEPEQIDENTCIYRDESGAILATVKTIDDTTDVPPDTRATVYGFHWTLGPSQYQHASQGLNATNSITLYFSVTFSRSGSTYMGYYLERNETYYWLGDPVTNTGKSYAIIIAAGNIHFAVKNVSSYMITYDGRFSLAPF